MTRVVCYNNNKNNNIVLYDIILYPICCFVLTIYTVTAQVTSKLYLFRLKYIVIVISYYVRGEKKMCIEISSTIFGVNLYHIVSLYKYYNNI